MNADLNSRPIGIFDSGIGGLTAVCELRKILPCEDIIYLGDTARVPYGTRSRETVLKYTVQDFEFLKRQNVKFSIAACGTASSTMVGESRLFGESCTGVIEPAVTAAVEKTENQRIGVIATSASIRSGWYERLIKAALPSASVFSKACPMFVPLVENGYTARDCAPTVEIAKEYLLPLKREGIDVLILGCTHYPLLSEIIADILGSGVALISSGAEAARFAKNALAEKGLLRQGREGKVKFFCTDSPELFRESAAHFLDIGGIEVERCSVESAE